MDTTYYSTSSTQLRELSDAAPSQPLWVSGRARFPASLASQTTMTSTCLQGCVEPRLQSQPHLPTQQQEQRDLPERIKNGSIPSSDLTLADMQTQRLCPYDPVELTVSALEALAFEYDTSSSTSSSSSSSSRAPSEPSSPHSSPRSVPQNSSNIGNSQRRKGHSHVLSLPTPSAARIDSILATLRAYAHDARAAEGVVALLRTLAASSHAASETIGAMGGADIVVAVLTSFCETDVAVAGQALMTIANLASFSHRNKQRLLRAGSLRAIVLAVDAHMRDSPHVVIFGCLAVRNIAAAAPVEAASAILNADVTALIVRVLHAANRSSDANMALHALRAFSNIVSGHDSPEPSPIFKSQRQLEAEEPHDLTLVKIRIRSSGGLEALVDSLVIFSAHNEVLEASLSAMYGVVQASPANAAKFGEVCASRGIQAILSLIGASDNVDRVCSFVTMSQGPSGSSSPAARQGSSVSSATATSSVTSGSRSSSSSNASAGSSVTSGSGSAVAFGAHMPSQFDLVASSPISAQHHDSAFQSANSATCRNDRICRQRHLDSERNVHNVQEQSYLGGRSLSQAGQPLSLLRHHVSSPRPNNPAVPSSTAFRSFSSSTSETVDRAIQDARYRKQFYLDRDSRLPSTNFAPSLPGSSRDVTDFSNNCQANSPTAGCSLLDGNVVHKLEGANSSEQTAANPSSTSHCRGRQSDAPDPSNRVIAILALVAEVLQALTLVQTNREIITRKHGISAIVDLIRELTPSARDVPAAMLALWRCLVGSEIAAAQACIARAAPAVVQVMQRHPHRRAVQRLGLALLVALTELNDGNRHAACSAGAVSAVYFALTEHGRSEDVVARGCRFMLLLSPLNILSSGIDLDALLRVVTLRRSRHSISSIVQRSTRDLMEAIDLIPGDVAKVVDHAGVAFISADWMVLGKNGDLEHEIRSGRATNSGSAVSSRTASHDSGGRSGKSSGRLNFRQRRRDTILGSAQGNGGRAHGMSKIDVVYGRGRSNGCFETSPRASSGGRLLSAITSRLCVKDDPQAVNPATQEARGVAVAGYSSKWRASESGVSVSSLRSSIGSRLRSSRRRAVSYSTATQYVAMRPLRSTLKDTREQEAALRTSHGENGNDFASVDRDGNELPDIVEGRRIASSVPDYSSHAEGGRRARSEMNDGPSTRYAPLTSGHSFSNDGSGDAEHFRTHASASNSMLRGRPQGMVSSGVRRIDAQSLLENRARQLLLGDDDKHSVASTPNCAIVGSGMSSAGTSHRPEGSRLRSEHQIGQGSGRRGESGSLPRRGGSDSPHSSPGSDKRGSITYHDLDHAIPS